MNLSSNNDYSLPSDLDFLKWNQPGICCMEFVKSKKSLFFSSANALGRVLKFHKGLSTFSLKNKQLLKDLKKYGPYSFPFILLEYGKEKKRGESRNEKRLYDGNSI